jgi:hypothetical protein
MARNLLPAALLALAIAGCQQPSDDNIAIDESNVSANADIETLPPDETVAPADNSGDATAPAAESATVIPAQYHGRWGMVPGDCTSTRGDNKGLITIADKTVKFYESTATLKEQRPAIATSFAGLFAFTGEGQSWEKVMTFTRTGDTLKRAEEEGSFNYKRCA